MFSLIDEIAKYLKNYASTAFNLIACIEDAVVVNIAKYYDKSGYIVEYENKIMEPIREWFTLNSPFS